MLTDSSPAPLDIELRLQQARPRLIRLARSFRLPADVADDIAQETSIQAWRRIAQMRSEDCFDAWLDAICRNQCRMYLRTQRVTDRHLAFPMTTQFAGQGGAEESPLAQLADQQAPDPFELLDRGELAVLLERALDLLPRQARIALELRYLHDLSGAEVAARLAISPAVLETRLHRARQRVRDALAGPLYEDALAFGLIAPPVPDNEQWQATRITCYLCGKRRLLGMFAQTPTGQRELRLRCPACSAQHGVDVFRSKGIAPLDGLRAYRPALARSMRALVERMWRSLATGGDVCLHCGALVRRQIVTSEAFPADLSQTLHRHWSVAACQRPGCPGLGAWSAVDPALWSDPAALRFMAEHPHWMMTPEERVDWQGRAAIHLDLLDVTSAARLALFIDLQDAHVLGA